jgi:hypothetical protein
MEVMVELRGGRRGLSEGSSEGHGGSQLDGKIGTTVLAHGEKMNEDREFEE